MLAAIKRSKSDPEILNTRAKVFTRRQEMLPEEIFYQSGVEFIIKKKKKFSIAPDTAFFAIDIYRQYLSISGTVSRNNVCAVCMACISLATKMNEIYPPSLEEIANQSEDWVKKQCIIVLEARVLRLCDYSLPLESNILTKLLELLGGNRQYDTEKCVKILFEAISNPYFMKTKVDVLCTAAILFAYPGHPLKRRSSKSITAAVHKMKHHSLSL